MGRISRDKRDVFYRKAKECGYRARSAFKLIQIDEEFDLFGRRHDFPNNDKLASVAAVVRAVDLCAAPGGWSQVLAECMLNEYGQTKPVLRDQSGNVSTTHQKDTAAIVAVDLWPMEPLTGVHCIQGDITSLDTARQIIDLFAGERAQLVVCDGAPDVTGLHSFDHYIQSQLLMSAINITTHVLCPGGTFVGKIFRGRDIGLIYTQLELLFQEVVCAKPTASRNASIESFVVCRGFGHGKLATQKCMNLELEGGWDESAGGVGGLREYPGQAVTPTIVPFVVCDKISMIDRSTIPGGFDFLDSDKSYPVNENGDQHSNHVLAPLAPPIRPPYEVGMAKLKKLANGQS